MDESEDDVDFDLEAQQEQEELLQDGAGLDDQDAPEAAPEHFWQRPDQWCTDLCPRCM